MGTLYIVATPIGNLKDITIRAIQVLLSADYIACEDTRRAGLLLQQLYKHYQIEQGLALHLGGVKNERPVLLRYDDHMEISKAPEIIALLTQGKSVALISDAGTPLISDPGYILVSEARKRAIPVISVPGASAVIAALASSGLPADTWMFLGYPPQKQGHRRKLFEHLISMNRLIESTYIFYCAPHKLHAVLEDMQTSLGDIDIVLCRELTKVHEEYWSGSISRARAYFAEPKGEFVLLIKLPIR